MLFTTILVTVSVSWRQTFDTYMYVTVVCVFDQVTVSHKQAHLFVLCITVCTEISISYKIKKTVSGPL